MKANGNKWKQDCNNWLNTRTVNVDFQLVVTDIQIILKIKTLKTNRVQASPTSYIKSEF